MYGISFTYIYHEHQANVGECTVHMDPWLFLYFGHPERRGSKSEKAQHEVTQTWPPQESYLWMVFRPTKLQSVKSWSFWSSLNGEFIMYSTWQYISMPLFSLYWKLQLKQKTTHDKWLPSPCWAKVFLMRKTALQTKFGFQGRVGHPPPPPPKKDRQKFTFHVMYKANDALQNWAKKAEEGQLPRKDSPKNAVEIITLSFENT